ncbi:peptidoglycan -binding protein [Alsobacter sp. SYSU M60028]|uniref:Peptidoglycan -binding protein n=1 Tax=Alsobacter ponti TaxID=2962936 RepID=A0ABT1LH06_9HYPH|nr:peptidoglycan -binding protein [Alsobacter ponti]MCP8940163.1 peptidoglycan -binding protein [Alsobacter ponti]
MAGSRTRRGQRTIDYWPGFVDALSTLVLAIVFLLTVFVLAQFFLSQQVTDKDTALTRLNRQISELTDLLALEKINRKSLEDNIAMLTDTLKASEAERSRLQGQVDSSSASAASSGGQVSALNRQLDAEKQVSARALSQVEILNQQIAALRRQLASLEAALDASEQRDKESQARIADLGSRLNVALAQKVQELARFRSEFFGRLRQVLGNRPDIRIVGDRFVFQSELFFDPGQATLNPAGQQEMDKLSQALVDLDKQIPADIPWVLRVDGHTDKRPLSGAGQFKNNWELSASRAIAVVQYLISKGVPPQRLVAAGFGEFQPLELGDSEEAYRRNRRIELKLTER